MRAFLGLVGIGGACLFFGDGVITPAISVLSAVEGLEVVSPEFNHVVLPIPVVVIIALFAVQVRGTASIGRLFGPVMAVWFVTLAGLGAAADRRSNPAVLDALSPHLCLPAVLPARLAGLRGAGLGGAGCHRRGGALRRHGPFRRPADPHRLVLSCCPACC